MEEREGMREKTEREENGGKLLKGERREVARGENDEMKQKRRKLCERDSRRKLQRRSTP